MTDVILILLLIWVGLSLLLPPVSLFIVARKLRQKWPWLAFIPIFGDFLACQCAQIIEVPSWRVLALPFVRFFAVADIWAGLSARTGVPTWIGSCCGIPLFGGVASLVVAIRADGDFAPPVDSATPNMPEAAVGELAELQAESRAILERELSEDRLELAAAQTPAPTPTPPAPAS
jgi:hypothetical protein